jgi:hypothetical protein
MKEFSSRVDSYRSAFNTEDAYCRYGQKEWRFATDLCQKDSNTFCNQTCQDIQLAEQLS